MLTALFEHHRDRALRGEIKNVIVDCHVRGVWSMMLHDEPGNRMRVFWATPIHELAPNNRFEFEPMTIAAHPHHCDITLVKIFGSAYNHVVQAHPEREGQFVKCEYRSAIKDGQGGLVNTGERFVMFRQRKTLIPETGDQMGAHQLHTISVAKGQEAAWLVLEGREDPNYRPICYTNNPVFDAEGLYRKGQNAALTIIERCLTALNPEKWGQPFGECTCGEPPGHYFNEIGHHSFDCSLAVEYLARR